MLKVALHGDSRFGIIAQLRVKGGGDGVVRENVEIMAVQFQTEMSMIKTLL
jgi:hypothetical protein